jgi:hypothetical protein
MEVLQQIKLARSCPIPDLNGKTGTMVQAYRIEPGSFYRLNLNRKRTQTKDDCWYFYLLDCPYGQDEYMARDDCHPENEAIPYLAIETDNGERHGSKCEERGIELMGCHNQINFVIYGDFPACDKCNIIWLRTVYKPYKSIYNAEDGDDDDDDDNDKGANIIRVEEDIPFVMQSSIAIPICQRLKLDTKNYWSTSFRSIYYCSCCSHQQEKHQQQSV